MCPALWLEGMEQQGILSGEKYLRTEGAIAAAR